MLTKYDDTFRFKLKSLLTISAYEVGVSKAWATRLFNGILRYMDREFNGKKPEEQLRLFMDLTNDEIKSCGWLKTNNVNGESSYKILNVARQYYKKDWA